MKRLLLLPLAVAVGCSSSALDPADAVSRGTALPASAVAQMEALIQEKLARTPAQRKISSQLLYANSGRFSALMAARHGEPLQSLAQRDAGGRVLVDIKGDAALQDRVAALGGSVVVTSSAHKSTRAWMPLGQLETLAAEPTVQTIRPALQATTWRADDPNGGIKLRTGSREDRIAAVQQAVQQSLLIPRSTNPDDAIPNVGSVTSQGSGAIGAERARKFFDTDGTGVRIGVLSDSDDLKEQSIATGDLPPDEVTVPGQDGRPGTGEGTAMMEIVHDVAPGAKLFFATAFNSPESFADNIRVLRSVYHCDIIVDDIIYFFESPYQDDIIAQAVRDVTDDGALYFSSAGNGGNDNDGTSGTWEGDFKAGGTLATLPSGYTVHDFGNGVISDRIEVGGGPLILHWSDRGTLDDPASGNDYDLFVLDQDLRNVLLASTDIQDGTGLPFEQIAFLLPANVRVVIARHPGAQTRAVRTVLFNGELGLSTAGSTFGHNSAAGAISVAATDVAEAIDGLFVAGPTTPVELFSSDGFRRIFYDRDGVVIGNAPTFAGGGGELRKKPDITSADGVSTTLPSFTGLNPFFGTSAAAPHAAALAGLIKSAVPTANAAKIKKAIVAGALDIAADGPDRDSGAGIANALNGLREAGAKPKVFLELVGSSLVDAVVPGGTGQLNVSLVNNGGATATNVTATLLTGSPFLTVTRKTGAWADLAPGASGTNVAPFLFTVAANAPCGVKLAATLVVSFGGNGTSPRAFGVSIQTGRPSATPTTFSYTGPVVPIPDANAAGVNVPLAVTAPGAISKLVFRIDGATCTDAVGATTVGVDHSWVGDLIFRLTSPAGTTVAVINRAGGALNGGNNFCQTVLDDGAASSIQAVTEAQAPFTGTFTPNAPEAAFVGQTAAGTWTLNVSDNAIFDTGSVRAFSLDVSGFSCN